MSEDVPDVEGNGQSSADEMIKLYEEMFANRYTGNDKQYMECVNRAPAAPPCVANWYTHPKRTYDWTRDRDRGGRHAFRPYRGRNWQDGGRNQDYNDRPQRGGYRHDRVSYAGRRNDYHDYDSPNNRYRPY